MLSDRGRKLLDEAGKLTAEERAEFVDALAKTLLKACEEDDLDLDHDELDRRMEEVRRGNAAVKLPR